MKNMANGKVLGGEFSISYSLLSKEKNSLSPHYSLGRTCLYSILCSINFQLVMLPDYICCSVGEVPVRLNIPYKHYHIDSNLLPDINSVKSELGMMEKHNKTAILIVTYFGLVDIENSIFNIRKEFPDITVIVDDVQNYFGFGHHKDFDYCFNSYRKWFPVPDGADILQKNNNSECLRWFEKQPAYAQYKCAGNLLKNYQDIIEDQFILNLIDQGEKMMNDEYRFSASDISRKLIRYVDIKMAGEKRKKNACLLHQGLETLGIKHIYDSNRTPLCVPIFVDNRDKIRKQLFEQNIFTPVHWPMVDKRLQGNNILYEHELSLICDQRYDEKDMDRIIKGIENAM